MKPPHVSREDLRRFRAILHRCETRGPAAVTEQLGKDARSCTGGYLAFLHMVCPEHAQKLRQKHPWTTTSRLAWSRIVVPPNKRGHAAVLKEVFQGAGSVQLLGYEVNAADEFERLRQTKVRVGTKDLRIAAICLANDATLLTRNSQDFGRVPGLRFED